MNVSKVTTLYGPGIKIVAQDDGGAEIHLLDLRQLAPGMEPVAIEMFVVPFSPDAWQRFKRNVEADGSISPIAVATSVPRI